MKSFIAGILGLVDKNHWKSLNIDKFIHKNWLITNFELVELGMKIYFFFILGENDEYKIY